MSIPWEKILGFIFPVARLVHRDSSAVYFFKRLSSHAVTWIRKGDFLCPNNQFHFYKGISLIDRMGERTNIRSIEHRSYWLEGEAGCGKSSVLQREFLKNQHNLLRWRSVILYFHSSMIDEYLFSDEKKHELLANLELMRSPKVYLYVDGLDEIGDANYCAFSSLVQTIREAVPSLVLKISCRSEYVKRHLLNDSIIADCVPLGNRYKIKEWSISQLQQFSKHIIKRLPIARTDRKNILYKIDSTTSSWKNLINSPLLMKQYIYVLQHKHTLPPVLFVNKYEFYKNFITLLIEQHGLENRITYQDSDVWKKLSGLADHVFEQFCLNSKYIASMDEIAPLLKKPIDFTENGANSCRSLFVHHTYYEFFVAHHYFSCLLQDGVNRQMIHAMSRGYANEFADFITDAIKNTTQKNTIRNKLMCLYWYTIAQDRRDNYLNLNDQIAFQLDWSVLQCVNDLRDNRPKDFFVLKYEIVFRLGRLGIEDQLIKDCLRYIYDNDSNIGINSEVDYFRIVLKRCCAISASLIGEFSIEIDYVEQMLNLDSHYDVANRSHTLIFYGDVEEASIYDFKDLNSVKCPWNNARKKRINRLSVKLENDVSQFDGSKLKYYRFRLFDLATIYTFLKSRSETLEETDLAVVKSCNVEFNEDQSRNDLMKRIKRDIINL